MRVWEQAAKDLMVRRVKALNDQTKTASALEAAKAKGKKVLEAQDAATNAKDKFEMITKSSKDELKVCCRKWCPREDR